jgi:hypothetical protein
MERDAALDAVLDRREQRNRVWTLAAVNAAVVTVAFALGVWLFPG